MSYVESKLGRAQLGKDMLHVGNDMSYLEAHVIFKINVRLSLTILFMGLMTCFWVLTCRLSEMTCCF